MDKHYIHECISLIENKLKWGTAKEWSDAQFKKLSELVLQTTHVSISTPTLKRLFGKVKTSAVYNPQYETKNALAQYLSYKDWEHFKQENETRILSVNRPPENNNEPNTYLKKKSKVFWIGLITLTLTFGSFWFFKPSLQFIKGADEINFQGKFLKGNVPLTVLFTYNVSGAKTDSNYISSHGNTFKHLQKQRNTISEWFEYAGYYRVNLLVDNVVKKHLMVHAFSKGWESVLTHGERNQYFHLPKDINEDGILRTEWKEISISSLDSIHNYWVLHQNVKEFNGGGEDFILEARMKNNSIDVGICNDEVIAIQFEHGFIRLHFVQPGCAIWVNTIISELKFNGENYDLSNFAFDLTQWHKIKIESLSKNVSVYMNDRVLFSNSYTTTLGQMKGISIETMGNGSTDKILIKDSHENVILDNDF